MKKILAIIFSVILIFVLAIHCSANAANETDEWRNVWETTAPTDTTLKLPSYTEEWSNNRPADTYAAINTIEETNTDDLLETSSADDPTVTLDDMENPKATSNNTIYAIAISAVIAFVVGFILGKFVFSKKN